MKHLDKQQLESGKLDIAEGLQGDKA